MKKATTLEEIYDCFAHEQYLTKEDEPFYVELYEKDMKLFFTALKNNKRTNRAFFIAGQSGNGKSSELNMLTTKYPALLANYEFFYIAGRTIFLYEDIDIVDIILMIGNVLSKENEALKSIYIEKLKKFEEVKDGTLELQSTESHNANENLSIGAKLSIGGKFFHFLKTSIDFESSYRVSEEIREDARRLFKIKRKELLDLTNELILEYKKDKNTDKELVIVIDDLEKKDNIDELFLKDMSLLNELNLVKIITMPIHLHRNQTFPSSDVREFGLKLKTFDNEPTNDNQILKNVVLKRLDVNYQTIIDESSIDLAVKYSGGNLRQLIRLINIAAENAIAFKLPKITTLEVKTAIETIGRAYSSKVINMKSFLNEIVENKTYEDNEANLQNIAKATKMELIFAYFNGIVWYEINPVIEDALKKYNK